jgi:signal transduction histidine kinase
MSSETTPDRQSDERIDGLGEISRRLADCGDAAGVHWTVVESLDAVVAFDAAVFYAVADGKLRPQAVVAETLHRAASPEVGEGIAGTVLQTGEPRLVDDLGDEPTARESDRFASALTVPVDDEHGLQLLSTEVGAFSATDRAWVEVVCREAANALDRVVAQQRADRERDEFAVLFENVADPVLRYRVRDGTPVVDRVNATLTQQFDVAAETAVGTPLDELPGQLEAEPPEWEAARRGERVERRLERQTTDGVRQFLMRTVPGTPDAPTQTGTGYVLYVDVEESRRREQLEVLNRFLRHNVRNDISVMRAHLEQVHRTVDDEAVADHVETTLRAADRLERRSRKAREAQDLISATAGRTTTRFDLTGVVTEQVAAVRENFPEAAVELDCPDETVAVAADDNLPLAVAEVLENGVVHTDDSPSVEVTVTTTDATATVTVADDGPGIPEQETRVVERRRETQIEHGRGIGLWLVAWIVDASDGQLSFDTPEEGGSVVRLSLPRLDD